ncbi:Riboflavin transporter FmnP [Pseudobutyrivibrio sp. YE44]|uniref:ECF transporter S component n=1 Tax=Pseudobutyrivibrio sp. YE44 TaxID=1520802 RepID=UPI000881AA58|nr:ECF transporter S component [Pseudobutyrivibrio sp. YE44]SDB48551.1 Riboflavin transporter FmnP [Pseudobutyrivibrio sp. YE44]
MDSAFNSKMETKTMKKVNVRNMTVTAMLSAIGFILMYLDTATPFAPSFLKMDISDLPALIASFALGPVWGVAVSLIKNVLHLPVSSSSCIGELSNFILCSSFVLPAGLIYHHKKTKKNAILGAFVGLVVMSAMALPSNLFLIYPLYYKIGFAKEALMGMYQEIADKVFPFMNLDSMAKCILYFNVPFTFVKGMLSAVITIFIYQPLRPLLKGNN